MANRGGDSSATTAATGAGVAGGTEGGCGLQSQENLCAFSSLLAVMWGWDSHIPPMSLPHPTSVCPASHPSCSISCDPASAGTSAGRGARGEAVGLCVSPSAPLPCPAPTAALAEPLQQLPNPRQGSCRSRLWEMAAEAGQEQDVSTQPQLPCSTAGQASWRTGLGDGDRAADPGVGLRLLWQLLPFTSPIPPEQTGQQLQPPRVPTARQQSLIFPGEWSEQGGRAE